MYIGANELEKVYLGTTELEKIYIGSNSVYEKQSGGGIDEHTVLMLHLDESLDDSSSNNISPYIYSGPATYVEGKFDKALNHTQYIRYESSVFNSLSTNGSVCTVDFWTKKTDYTNSPIQLQNNGSNVASLGRTITGDTLRLGDDYIYFDVDISDISANAWFHIAWIKTGEVENNRQIYKAYVNGIYKGNYASSSSYSTTRIRIYDKYIDELRVSDIIRWDGNFTPPTQPYS